MEKIDPHEYRKRLDRLTGILTGIAEHAGRQSMERCPYKNRLQQCTASFGCRNKRKAAAGPPMCAGDDKLDYRGAWETSA
ncbi:MAG: hypothetical protein HY235_14630 [Acidobacteria bacterium]|nr:hypothetical protein [Acidobacteriota bacterium]